MNREQTLALYAKGRDAWNEWAEEMLAKRKELEEAGEWEVERDLVRGNLKPKNNVTEAWLNEAAANFLSIESINIFTGSVSFANFLFPSLANFTRTQFNHKANFENAIFMDAVWFNRAKFRNAVNFSGVSFKNNTEFEQVTFKGESDFSEAVFYNYASFTKSFFNNEASFESAKFKSYAGFARVIFHKPARFTDVVFNNTIEFSNTEFYDSVGFTRAVFNNHAEYADTKFSGKAKFDEVKFKSTSLFENVIFNNESIFEFAHFHGNAWFNNSLFKKHCFFNGTIFHGDAVFAHTRIMGVASFNEVTFALRADFDNVKITSNAWFSETLFFDEALFVSSVFKNFTSFRKAEFKAGANFNAIRSESAFSLEGTKFSAEVPDFIQAHFEEAPRLDHIEINDGIQPGRFWSSITQPIHADLKARYQALKRLAIQAHDHENEQLFWAKELRISRALLSSERRNLRNILWLAPLWLVNFLYEMLSNYGRSIFRPILTWALIILFMTCIHLSNHFKSHHAQTVTIPAQNAKNTSAYPPSLTSWLARSLPFSSAPSPTLQGLGPLPCNPVFSAFYLSLQKSLLGLGWDSSRRLVSAQNYACLYGTHKDTNKTPIIPSGILILQMLQTLLSALLIFLLLLALRNNFKLK